MEEFITGYCRCIDKSRIVLVEDGEADCDYANCPYREACEIGKRIRQMEVLATGAGQ